MPRFVPRERKHKRIARQKKQNGGTTASTLAENSNADIILPPSNESQLGEGQQHSLATLPNLGKASSKKRKRLQKYLDTKLRKDENAELLKKLAQQQVDTSLLRSSKKLGRGGDESKRERLERALRERERFGVEGGGENVLLEARADVRDEEEEEEEEEEDVGKEENESGEGEAVEEERASNGALSTFGGGLKRPLEVDGSGQAVIRKRKRRRKEKVGYPSPVESAEEDEEHVDVLFDDFDGRVSDVEQAGEDEDEEWDGFDSDGPSIGSQHLEGGSESETSECLNEDDANSTISSEPASQSGDEKAARISAFKAWADSQRNTAIGFTPSSTQTHTDTKLAPNFKPRALSPDPLLEEMPIDAASSPKRPLSTITIPRTEEIQKTRLELPVVQEEQKIMEAIYNNDIVIICGSTGSGKTTQVPQMLFEGGYGSLVGTSTTTNKPPGNPNESLESKGLIGITQPRRIAATSVANRVAYELGVEHKNRVAHQVRHDTNVSTSTALKFMTDGILLREIQSDFPLSKYSVIVLDEAHERSVNTDILIGLLSRIVRLRAELAREEPGKWYPLKLVIMSATLRINDFLQNERLFKDMPTPPVVEAEGRQFEVVEHFARRTQRDYVGEVVEKVGRAHKKLPPGGMLVFLTGREEIRSVEKRLKGVLGGSGSGWAHSRRNGTREGSSGGGRQGGDYLEEEKEDAESADSDTDIRLDDEDSDAEFVIPETTSHPGPRGNLKPHILPLYAALPANQQLLIFQPPPERSRQIVLATNVAETSLTIPGIRYVFDSGRSKEKHYEQATGIQTFEVDWISKASATQRKGRAGRTAPGHVWRLYSSAVYEEFFAESTAPEILRTPLESVVLQLKGLGIENVINFPFPTLPDMVQLEKAETLLRFLGAIGRDGRITAVGRELTGYPVSPRFGKMLMLARSNGIVEHAVAVVAGLAVGDLFVPQPQMRHAEDRSDGMRDESDDEGSKNQAAVEKVASEQSHQGYTRAQATLSRWDDHSDALKLLTAVAAHAEAQSKSESNAKKFCDEFFLREKGMSEIQQLRRQLHNILNTQKVNRETGFKTLPSLPTEKERTMLNQIVAAGYIDQVAIRADLLTDSSSITGTRKPRRAIEVPYRSLLPTTTTLAPASTATDKELAKNIFLHPSSVLAKLSVKEMPSHIIYSHLSRATNPAVSSTNPKKTRMHPITAIGPKALAVLAEGTPLLQIGKPVGKIEEVDGAGGGKRRCWIGVSLRPPVGEGSTAGAGAAWPLGTWKVVQRRGKGGWEVEEVLAR